MEDNPYVFSGIVLIIAAGITIAANLGLFRRKYRALVFFSLGVLNLGLFLNALSLLLLSSEDDRENTNLGATILIITALLASALLYEPVRQAIGRWFPRSVENKDEAESPPPLLHHEILAYMPVMSGGEVLRPPAIHSQNALATVEPVSTYQRGFDARNVVHMIAMVFCVYLFGNQLAGFVLDGGLSGLAEDTEINFGLLLLNLAPLLVISLLGVGLFTRRSWGQIITRLGLGMPSLESIGVGMAASIVLIIVQVIMVIFWILIVGQDTFEKQSEAAEAISENINTVWLALAVSFSAALGEEVAFRGALQPVFGLWWTSAFFTLIHMQYTLTPAVLIIFVVALGLGWLRQRYNLWAAMIAHFLYNFLPLLLSQLLN